MANTPRALAVLAAAVPVGRRLLAHICGPNLAIYQIESRIHELDKRQGVLMGHEALMSGYSHVAIVRGGDTSLHPGPCKTCPRGTFMSCHVHGGPINIVRAISAGDMDANDCDAMALAFENISISDVYGMPKAGTRPGGDGRPTWLLSPEALAGAGAWVSTRTDLFRADAGLSRRVDAGVMDELLARDPAIFDLGVVDAAALAKSLGFDSGDLASGWHKREPTCTSMVCTARGVRRAATAQWLARRGRALATRDVAVIRRENCPKCVYACERYTGRRACVLTAADLEAQHAPDEAMRKWMAMFCLSGERLERKLRGKTTQWMIMAPSTATGHGELMLRRLTPPYPHEPQAVNDTQIAEIEKHQAAIARLPVERQARMHFALTALWDHGHWVYGDAKFCKDRLGQHQRHRSRNDVLAIARNVSREEITVYSDTLAGSEGGFGGAGGGGGGIYGGRRSDPPPRISVDDRPRFQTRYQHPYTDDIMAWTGDPLGTPRSPLRIVK